MNTDSRRFYARLRLYTRTWPTVLAGVIVFATGYLTFQPPKLGEHTYELWFGILFAAACMAATETFSRIGLTWMHLARREIKREGNDALRLTAATEGLADSTRSFYAALIEVGEAAVLIAAPGGRLYVSTYLLRHVDPARIKLLVAHALEKLSMGVMLERILPIAVVWWIGALTILRNPLRLWITLSGALVVLAVQLILQEWLWRRNERVADKRMLERIDPEELAQAIAALGVLTGPQEAKAALGRITALGLSEDEAKRLIEALTQH